MKLIETTKTLIPVHGTHGCAGFLLRSARGFRTFDAGEKEIGVFPSAEAGVAALLAEPPA